MTEKSSIQSDALTHSGGKKAGEDKFVTTIKRALQSALEPISEYFSVMSAFIFLCDFQTVSVKHTTKKLIFIFLNYVLFSPFKYTVFIEV